MASGATHVLPNGLPAPQPTALDAPYWKATKRHELLLQQCQACNALQFPPEETCTSCGGDSVAWVRIEPRGTLHSWTRAWHLTHPALVGAVPYVIAVVSLADAPDVRVWGNLVDPIDGDLPIDAPVEAVFEDHEDSEGHDGYTLVQWRLT